MTFEYTDELESADARTVSGQIVDAAFAPWPPPIFGGTSEMQKLVLAGAVSGFCL
jgi:hypothetical protein